MTSVVITGAGGLLGRRLRNVLRDHDIPVAGVGRARALGVDEVIDLAHPGALDGILIRLRPSAVVHLAGGPSVGRAELHRRNVLTTVHLMDSVARRCPAARVVMAGSAAEYGNGQGVPLTEDAALEPVSEYGWSKVVATSLASTIAAAHGMALTVVRPFNVIADDLPPSSPLGNFRRQLLGTGGPVRSIRCGRVDVERDFITADDVVGVLHKLLARPDLPAVLNVCSGVPRTLEQIMTATGAELGATVVLTPDDELVALPAANRVVGDPARLAALGFQMAADTPRLARALLGSGLV